MAPANFEALLTEHYRANFAILVRRWRKRHVSQQATEDTISQTYLKILATYREQDQPPQSQSELDRLVHTVIKNKLADDFRREERVSSLEASAAPEHEADENADWWEQKSVSMPSIDAMALRDLVNIVIARMSPRHRCVMKLMILGFSPPEIGAKLQSKNFYADVRYAKEQFRRIVLSLAWDGNETAVEFAGTAFSSDRG